MTEEYKDLFSKRVNARIAAEAISRNEHRFGERCKT